MPRPRKIAVAGQENRPPTKATTSKHETPTKKQKIQPDWATGDGLAVAQLCLSIQKSDCNSNKVIAQLTKLYEKMGHASFMAVFKRMIKLFIVRDDSDEYAPRVLKFYGMFVASFGEAVDEDGGSHPIIKECFEEMLSLTSKLPHVRARICQFIANCMSSFSGKAEIDESIMDFIIEKLTQVFVRDISPIVRQHAIQALQRLQNPDDPDDPVTKTYTYHMETDPVARVRQTCITAIAKKLSVIPQILDRLQDTDEKVRRHTYLQMASFPVRSYKIVDRIKILNHGLYDRSELVKKAVHNILLPNWMAAYDNNYAEFTKAIKLDSSDKDLTRFRQLAQDTLKAIVQKRKFSEVVEYLNLSENEFKNCPALDKAGCLEWLLLWKVAIRFYQDNQDRNLRDEDEKNSDLEDVDNEPVPQRTFLALPELSVLCEYIDKYVTEYKTTGQPESNRFQRMNFNYCIITLLEIVELNDLGDEVGRERLKALMENILINCDVSEHGIKAIANLIELIVPSVEIRVKFFHKILLELVTPGTHCENSRRTIIEDLINKADMDKKLKANGLKMEMMDLKEKEGFFVERKEYANAQKVNEKYELLQKELIELLRPLAGDSTSQAAIENLNTATTTKKFLPEDILKNLRICFYTVMMKGMKTMTHELMETYNNFVRYHLESSDDVIRTWALKTASAYALLYESLAKDVYPILKKQFFENQKVIVWEAVINGLVDLLLRYGIEKMESCVAGNATLQNRNKKAGRTLYTDDPDEEEEMSLVGDVEVVPMLTAILERTDEIRILKAAIVGLSKLVLHGQHCTRELVSRFLLAYFNPATEPEINQILGVFFESVIRMKKQESLQEALIPTMVTLLEAPHDSPLREVKLETVLKFVIGATRPVFCSNGLNLHNTICLRLIEMMEANGTNKEIHKVFSKELLLLEVGDDPLLKRDMASKIEGLLNLLIVDARTRKNLTDFRDMMKGTYKPAYKFSSTAATIVDSDANRGESDNEEGETEKISLDEVMDVSLSQVKIMDVNVEVTRLPAVAESDEDEPVQGEDPDKDVFFAEASQEVAEEESPAKTQNVVDIPATQDDVGEETMVEDTNVTVMNVEVSETSDESEEEVVQPTQKTPKTPKNARKPTNKRQLEISAVKSSPRPSPMRKHQKSSDTPAKTTEVFASPRSKRAAAAGVAATIAAVSPRSRKGATTAVEPESPKPSSAPKTPKTQSKAAKVDEPPPKTPKNQAKSLPSSPRTPRFSGVTGSKASTPNTERQTRKQAREEMAQSSKVTRSASKILNVDPTEIANKMAVAFKTTKAATTEKTDTLSKEAPATKAGPTKKLASKLPVPSGRSVRSQDKNVKERPRWR